MKAITLKASTAKEKWIKIGAEGAWDGHIAGKFDLAEDDFNEMVENFTELSLDVVVDYEHQTLYGEKAPAAGWIKQPSGLKVEKGELYAKIEWNDAAKQHIKDGEYKYLSPVFTKDTTHPKSGVNIGWTLHSVAMTNKPFLSEIDPIPNKSKTEEHNMKTKELEDQVSSLQTQVTTLTDENKTLKEQNESFQASVATTAVDTAIANKKISKEQKEWALKYANDNPEGFIAFVDSVKETKAAPADNQFANTNTNNNQAHDEEVNMSKM